MEVHLDTDFAGDTDDAAALALLLGWESVELLGVTTVADPDGRRAGYVEHVLRLAGRVGVPVVAGAATSSTTGAPMGGLPDHPTYWGGAQVTARPSPPGAADELLLAAVERGATIVAIGPVTNLAELEAARPGSLASADVVQMGGWIEPPRRGLPPWGAARDWNVQCDTAAATTVLERTGHLTLVPLGATLRAHLRLAHVERLEASGPLGRLLARQGRAHGEEHGLAELARAHAGLPDDLLNFQHDPLACAVAVGWPGVARAPSRLRPQLEGGVLRFVPHREGRPVEVVTEVDGDRFAEAWLSSVERADELSARTAPGAGGPDRRR